MSETETAKPLTTKQQRAAGRRQLKHASLNEQLAWWKSLPKDAGFKMSVISKECERIQRQINRLSTYTCSMTWADDLANLRPKLIDTSYPPCDDAGAPLMVRARAERVFYPRAYITTSGFAFDVFLEAVMTGTTRRLYESSDPYIVTLRDMRRFMAERKEMPDGYVGGRVAPFDLPRVERDRIHRAEALSDDGTDGRRMITNVF